MKRTSHLEKVEDAVVTWIDEMNHNPNGNAVTRSSVKLMANLITKELLRTPQTTLSEVELDALSRFKQSDGWITRVEQRNQMRSYYNSGTSGFVTLDTIAVRMNYIRDVLSDQPRNLIFNLDEFGLNYKSTSRRSIQRSMDNHHRQITNKDKLSVVLTTNWEGRKFPLTVIGRYAHPRCFQNYDVKKALNTTYLAQQKRWQSAETFTKVIEELNTDAKSNGLMYYLIIDNCSSHVKAMQILDPSGSTSTQFKTGNLVVLFLPPNSTSKCQPFNGGIIPKSYLRIQRY